MMGARVWVLGLIGAATATSVLVACGSSDSNAGSGGAAGSGSGGSTAGSGGSAAGSAGGGAGGSAGSGGSGTAGGSGGSEPHEPLVLGVAPPKTGTFTDARDQTQYGWVEINGVKWMSENLRYLLNAQDVQTCYFDTSTLARDCSKAGYFYGWSAAMGLPLIATELTLGTKEGTYQGLCPAGWRLPARADWRALLDYVNELADAEPPVELFGLDYRGISDPLLSATGWRDGYGTNELGLNLKPYDEHSLDLETSFWTSDESGRQSAGRIRVFGSSINVDTDFKEFVHAVRCIEGEASRPAPVPMGPALTHTSGTFTDPRDQKSYATVTIGAQQWLAQNLAYEPPTGDSLCYAEQADHCRIFGRLYGRETAQTVCPATWHTPTVAEWQALAKYIDDNTDELGVQEADGSSSWKIGQHVLAPWEVWQGGPKEAPSFGLNALPGGWAVAKEKSNSLDHEAFYWPSTTEDIVVEINATYLTTTKVRPDIEAYVRCLHD